MKQETIIIDENESMDNESSTLREMIKKDRVIAFPTETVYGLGGNAYSDEAVKRIFQVKQRPADNPLIVHIHCMEQLNEFTEHIHPDAYRLMKRYWPGPITFIVPIKQGMLSHYVTAGLNTVGVRMPNHDFALQFLRIVDTPIAAPSANMSGRPSPTKFSHIEYDLYGRADVLIRGDDSIVGVESTVVDTTVEPFEIVRPGHITAADIMRETGIEVIYESTTSTTPKSPGMKYRHYAPKQPVYPFKEDFKPEGHVGVIAPAELITSWNNVVTFELCESVIDVNIAMRNLYKALRFMDAQQVDTVYIYQFPRQERYNALNNRIDKVISSKEEDL